MILEVGKLWIRGRIELFTNTSFRPKFPTDPAIVPHKNPANISVEIFFPI